MHISDRLFGKRWGVFTHYLDGIQNNPGNPLNQGAGRTSWNDCVHALDVGRLADSLKRCSAGYYFITLMQGNETMIAPNRTFDEIAGTKPGEACAERDLVSDLYDALTPLGIDLCLYYTGDGPYQNPVIGQRFGFTEPRDRGVTEDFVRRWASVLEEYAVRYGDKVKAWWIDGCYRDYFRYTDALMEPYCAAVKRGNPEALVAMNNGVFPDYRKNYCREDFVCGEFNDLTVIPRERFLDGAQTHLLAPLGVTWGRPGCRYSGQYLRHFTRCVNEAGGIATYDCALYRDGSIDEEQIAALAQIDRV
ncbi:MAG: hypothetical protein J6V24_07710 [Clostridia bacterium]|nr:hypothetical protein [Clostridia bacterium]